jgi:phosphoribosyl 1,2-cyclic phosphate phosphodiesterase
MRNNCAQRSGCSIFLHDINALFDAPEEIAAEMENAGIDRMDHLFFTHWHPDHTMGARILEIMNTEWSEKPEWRMAAKHRTHVHMPGPVYDETMSRFGQFLDFWQKLGIAALDRMDAPVRDGNVMVEAVVFESVHRTMTHSTAYVVSSGERKFVYAPCDITPFPRDGRFHGCDLMILQAGWCGPELAERARNGPHYEISMDEILDICRAYSPKRVLLTHIGDEAGLLESDLKDLEARHSRVNISFASDGMVLEL